MEFYRGVRVRRGRGENYLAAFFRLISRNRRRYGGYIVHMGVVLIVIGITASSAFVTQEEATLKRGEVMSVGKYTLRFDELRQYTTAAKDATAARLTVYGSGLEMGAMVPEKNVYKYEGNREINQETEVALRSTFKDDLYVILTNFDGSGSASFRAIVNPMVSWIWAGGVVLILGAIVTMWPSAKEIRKESVVRYNVETTKESTAPS
jgi:cytochrome c-type biogenesis protein CcmF